MLALSLATVAAALSLQAVLPRRATKTVPLPIESCFLLHDENRPTHALRTSQRDGNVALVDQPTKAPRTILVIINESAGHHVAASEGPGVSLSSRLCQLGGGAGKWFMPENAVTNSSMTDISLPSILTGCGAHESIEKLHRLPTVFDLAKARGYKTAFFASATLNWLNLDKFFAIDAIDERVTVESLGLPITNDQGGDDYIVAAQTTEWIKESDDDLFVVLYLNALHVPFLSESACQIPASIVTRRDRAAFVVEACHKILFETLEMTGRFDDGLIISVGDHGETVENSVNEKGHYSRLINLPSSVLRPIFIMKPPQGLSDDMTQSLARNSEALIANIDIAPTIAHILGAAPRGDDVTYEGFSLFADIPKSRIAFTLNVNQWRSWDRGCVAISRGNARVTVDYQTEDLCVYSYAGPEEDEALRHSNKEELLMEGLGQEIVRNAISKIFRDKLRMYPRSNSRRARDVPASNLAIAAERQGAATGPRA